MSQENVEIVRRILSEFGETLQPVSDLISPDVIWNNGSWTAWTGPTVYRGTDGFTQFFGEWIAAYEEWTQEVEEIVDELDRYGVSVRDRSEVARLHGNQGQLTAVTLADGDELPSDFMFLFL